MAAEMNSGLILNGLRTVAVLALIAPLPACVLNNPLDRQLTSAVVLEPSPLDGYQYELAKEVPVARAFVEVPVMAGSMIAVREKRYANGVEQTMVLESEAAADGENRIEVRVTQPGAADSRIKNEYVQVRTSRAEQIRSDMKEFVWGVPMQIVGSVEANAYGTYGYALGRSKLGYNCLLGWQNVKGTMKQKKFLGFITTRFTEMSVRLRICRTDLSQDQLVSIMRGMRITVDPETLMDEPKMIWRNDGYNVSGAQTGNGTMPGYVTEGVAMPEGSASAPDMAVIAPQPSAEEPVYQSAPTAKRKPVVRNAPQRDPLYKKPKIRSNTGDGDVMVDNDDPTKIPQLDKDRNQTTIYVDPREYATVPAPGEDITQEGTIAEQPAVVGKPSVYSSLGKKSTVKPSATGGAQSDLAREQRKEQVRQIPLGTQSLGSSKLDRNGTKNAGYGSGATEDSDLFLAPEREGYRGLKIEELQRQTQKKGKKALRNLWLNDVARSDRDGMPLDRPCELLRNQKCDDDNQSQ